jgi:glycine dehydrogenase
VEFLKHKLRELAERSQINFRYIDDSSIGIALDETTSSEDLSAIVKIFSTISGKSSATANDNHLPLRIPASLQRTSDYLTHPVFNSHHSETQLMRYMKSLENKDLALNFSMIPLGSCTMKLNAASEMFPVSFPEFSQLHPFIPASQAAGYRQVISELEDYLSEITGFAACSLQPNSGAQGEYAGLMVIMAYHQDKGEGHRDVVLIPSSAHWHQSCKCGNGRDARGGGKMRRRWKC